MKTSYRLALGMLLMNLPSLASAAMVVEVSDGVFEGTSTMHTTSTDGEHVCWEAIQNAESEAKMECSRKYGLSSEACETLATQQVAYGPLDRPEPNNGRPFISYCTAKATVLATSFIRVPKPKLNEAYIGTPEKNCRLRGNYSLLARLSTPGVQVGAFCKPVSHGYQQLTVQVNVAPHIKASPGGTVPVANMEFADMNYCVRLTTEAKNIVQQDGGFWFGGECKTVSSGWSKKVIWESLLYVRQ
jgi:hypothetical protein